MNNMKKVGLSALAGSLVAFSANAVELSVSGKTEITYSGKADSVNGNKWGNGNAITFSGSGDVNGMTATYTAVIQDGGQANSNTSETFASSSLMLDMGDMGTVGFDQGVGEFGVSTIDDKMPYAYEEIWTYTGASNGLQAAGGCNVLGYKNSFMGYQLSVELDPGHSESTTNTDGCTGDGGNTGAGETRSGYNWALTGAPIDGLNVGVGYGKEEDQDGVTANKADETFATGFATYAMGPATVGYQVSSADGGSAGTASKAVELYGVSFNVNENLAISVNQMDTEFQTPSTTRVTEETSGIGASYTMGSASVRLLQSETDNKGGVSTAKAVEHTEISLLLAF
jgi:outer membrane protein OmpU